MAPRAGARRRGARVRGLQRRQGRIAELAAQTPRTIAELAAIPGIGPAKLERYGPELLARLADLAA